MRDVDAKDEVGDNEEENPLPWKLAALPPNKETAVVSELLDEVVDDDETSRDDGVVEFTYR
jgi:hypothetical protein